MTSARLRVPALVLAVGFSCVPPVISFPVAMAGNAIQLSSRQITFGPKTHFFGYIGHVRTIPWNASGRYIVALESPFHDRMPGPDDDAGVVLIDTAEGYSIRVVDRTRAWNPQQGTMLYWNPAAPETQFFFNDRDPATGKVFCVLFDLSAGENGARVREYRFDDTPIGNGGVAQEGGAFLGINYARMARLRPVTGYREAWDWTEGVAWPSDDGIFRVDVVTGRKRLLVSFETLAERLELQAGSDPGTALFINHTLWNREDDRIFFFTRAGWDGRGAERINAPFIVDVETGELMRLARHIGGHPEWDFGRRMIGRIGPRQIVYDVERQLVVGTLGTPEIFPNPEGDVALSPDGRLFVNGHADRRQRKNFYTVYRRSDGAWARSEGFNTGRWTSGDLRQDPSPCWNRTGDRLLVPAVSEDGASRQLFLIEVKVAAGE